MRYPAPLQDVTRPQRLSFLLVVVFLLSVPLSNAQPAQRPVDAFYGKLGIGLSDYTGDFPAQNVSHPFDLQEISRPIAGTASGVPFVVNGELGYQFSPTWTLAAGFQGGNYPIVGYGGQGEGTSDSYRYTPQLLGRYTFGDPAQSVAPYVDGGINATFGGATSIGVGPSVGGGVNILLSRSLSLYVESRFNFTLPDDAIDGAETESNDGITGPFDSVNQLLGFGVKVTLTTPTPPRVIALDGPAEVQTGESVTFTAAINDGEAARPRSYQWEFGNGESGTGLTATHTYDRPGTYSVAFSARNEAGEARKSMTIEATRPSNPSSPSTKVRIASLTATPNPAAVGIPVQFSSAVEAHSAPTYEWSFGDGATATGSSPTHTYENPGQYTARLNVPTDAGTKARTVTVRVNPQTSQEGAGHGRAGRWGIVVASMSDKAGAEALAQRYRSRFPTETVSVDITEAETREGLRYRVYVGTFENDRRTQQAIEKHAEDLPSEAWSLRLE